jgi:hypothetical protein
VHEDLTRQGNTCRGNIFWTRRSGALGGEQAMIESWQVRRDGVRRGIVEIIPEEP